MPSTPGGFQPPVPCRGPPALEARTHAQPLPPVCGAATAAATARSSSGCRTQSLLQWSSAWPVSAVLPSLGHCAASVQCAASPPPSRQRGRVAAALLGAAALRLPTGSCQHELPAASRLCALCSRLRARREKPPACALFCLAAWTQLNVSHQEDMQILRCAPARLAVRGWSFAPAVLPAGGIAQPAVRCAAASVCSPAAGGLLGPRPAGGSRRRAPVNC